MFEWFGRVGYDVDISLPRAGNFPGAVPWFCRLGARVRLQRQRLRGKS
ncbi:hypothetical protein [Mesorhizobium intechi]|nr:hypothetical protein [Mesorhizobium intechi]